LALAILTIAACKADTSDPDIKALYDDVMYIHDEIMPEMTTIHKLKKSIRNKADNDSLALEMIQKLDEADESMMSWMADFGTFRKLDDAPKDERMQYLQAEYDKIKSVSNQMKTAIEEAQNYVDQNN